MPAQEGGVGTVAHEATSDARLVEECAAFRDAFSRYVHTCAAVAGAEAEGNEPFGADDSERPSSASWRGLLGQVSRSRARTVLGLVTKSATLGVYFAVCPADDPGADLINSLLADLHDVLT